MKEEAKQYHLVDRKLVSTDQAEVNEGLRELNLLLPRLGATDILNSVVMRLMDLYSSSKLIHTRDSASRLIISCRASLPELPSKDQVISILNKCLKSPDTYLRILTIQTITAIPDLFIKENSIYHLLLARLNPKDAISRQEAFRIIRCMEKLLTISEHLSKLFCNNLLEIISLGGVPINHILYLCHAANFETHTYPQIIHQLWNFVKDSNSAKTRYYFFKLLKKSAINNFMCYMMWKKYYEESNQMMEIKIEPFISHLYCFLEGNEINMQKLTDEELLDQSYIALQKHEDIFLEKCQVQCERRIKNAFESETLSFNHLLMTFYVKNNLESLFIRYFQEESKLGAISKIKWIKASLVTANFQFSLFLINNYFLTSIKYHAPLTLLAYYATLHCQGSSETLCEFLEIMKDYAIEFSNKRFLKLQTLWKKEYSSYLLNAQDSQMCEEIDVNDNDNNSAQFKEEIEYLERRERLYPKSIEKLQFSCIYFSKDAIFAIFRQ